MVIQRIDTILRPIITSIYHFVHLTLTFHTTQELRQLFLNIIKLRNNLINMYMSSIMRVDSSSILSEGNIDDAPNLSVSIYLLQKKLASK
jgi:hypothetical protein